MHAKRIGTFYGAGHMADVSIGKHGFIVQRAFARRKNRLDRFLELLRCQWRWWNS